jgi:hypothetical protein
MKRLELNPAWPWTRSFRISQGIRVGDTVYDYKAARAEAFPDRVPASSTVHSPELLIPGTMVEVEAVAVLP